MNFPNWYHFSVTFNVLRLQLGTIVFDPSKGEWLSQKPYLGLDQDDGRSSISSWINSLNGIGNQRVADNDARDYKLIRGLWNKIKSKRCACARIC